MKRLNQSAKGFIVAGIFMMGIHLAGCGGTKQAAVPNFDDQPWEVRVETDLDTLIYTEGQNPAGTTAGETEDAGLVTTSDYDPDPPEGWEDPSPVMETPVVTESRPAAYAEAVPEPVVFTPGWRVQIFASVSMVTADELATKARRLFTEPVYVEYEPPLYKVRVGDFLTKSEAKHMKNRTMSEDFDAWIVEALVVKPR